MQRYIDQLIGDLESLAKNPPLGAFIEPPPHLEDEPVISELALTPYKAIEEWTGLSHEVFPEVIQLSNDQCEKVNEAIFKVYESLNLELTDAPESIPPEALYEVLTSNWDYPVQYLPSSGMDLELCTGDPMDCPYGDYCSCQERWEEEIELPDKFEQRVPQIAQALGTDQVCFINTDTGEIEEIPEAYLKAPENFDAISGSETDALKMKHKVWKNYIEVEPPESEEMFQIMENFANDLEEEKMKDKLIFALTQKHPFAHFKTIVDNSRFHDEWFHFKQMCLENFAREAIHTMVLSDAVLNEDWMNGIFNDDGTKVDPALVPLPELCKHCKKYHSTDGEENMHCLMTRNDQRDEAEFKCNAFEAMPSGRA